MTKKIIIASILLLAVAVVFTACKKDDYEPSYTIPGENGEVITVYKDEEGNEFVTNIDGDKIPVTTSEEGFYDDIPALITQTTTKKPSGSTISTTKKPSGSTTTTTTTKPSGDKPTTTLPKETTTLPDVDFGKDNKTEDKVEWSDIVNAGKK